MTRRQLQASFSWIALLLCFGIFGYAFDGEPDDPLRLHGRSRCSRSVRVGDDLHLAPHSETDRHGHRCQPEVVPVAAAVILLAPLQVHGEWIRAHQESERSTEPLSRPSGRAPPLA